MPHLRQTIRYAVRDLLFDATAAEDRVHKTRVVPYRRMKLPAISVYTKSEPVDPASRSTAPRELTRNLQLVIEAVIEEGAVAWGAQVTDVDDALDELSHEIERAMDADPTLGIDAVDTSILSNTEQDVITEVEGRALDRPLAVVTLTYAVTYYTWAPDPADVTLDDLKTVDVKTSLGDVAPGNQAEDKIVNLET